jgi:hypothetical protein
MNHPSHDDISIAAHSLWKDRGCPQGIDTEIWLEAERQLRRGQTSGETREFARRAREEAAAESRDEYNLSASTSEEEAVRAAVRAPQGPRAGRGAQTRRASLRGGSGQAGLG